MIEDLLIWKFVAKHPHCTRANSNPAFSTVIVCTIALVGPCACRKSNPDILVVQPAENWEAKNLPGPFDGTRERRILLQG